MPKIEVNVTQEQMDQLKAGVREEWNESWSHDKMIQYLNTTDSISAMELLRQYNVYDRYEKLRNKPIGDLSRHERLICMLYWTMYESFGR